MPFSLAFLRAVCFVALTLYLSDECSRLACLRLMPLTRHRLVFEGIGKQLHFQ